MVKTPMQTERGKSNTELLGVNTGFGGSADSRTNELQSLQNSILQHTQSGVLTSIDKDAQTSGNENWGSHALPAMWVKATMLARCNSLIRGHSAVSANVIDTIVSLVRNEIIPIIPLRGTVSASGDLMTLSYIAGAIEGNPDIYVQVGRGEGRKVVSAKDSLALAGLDPVRLRAKEALGLINGTAPSAAVGSIALYETHHLAVLSQILTCMGVEALLGRAESFHPFISKVRPHHGQVEAAHNIRSFLKGSRLAKGAPSEKDKSRPGLYQDRYPLRTSSQWIGPQLEDLLLADGQISTELNSTTDNPLFDVANNDIYSGGNFQAASVTSAMEKARGSLQMLGKLLFSQCTEIINPALSNGLPTNLVADDPCLSFTMKGIDVNMAAYMSELGFLANPVASHVQSAEMHNQAINSLALLSARYTMQAVEVASLMCASYLYVACQALDLRVMHLSFLEAVKPMVYSITSNTLRQANSGILTEEAQEHLWTCVSQTWTATSTLDMFPRCQKVVEASLAVVVSMMLESKDPSGCPPDYLDVLKDWKAQMIEALHATFVSIRTRFFESQNTEEYLGHASGIMYRFVRKELKVPFHLGLVEQPSVRDKPQVLFNGRSKKTIGSWVSIIYESLRNGELHHPAMMCLEVGKEDGFDGMGE